MWHPNTILTCSLFPRLFWTRERRRRQCNALLSSAAAANWPSRVAVATPQSVSSWLQDANVEQRRALAQFLTSIGPGAAAASQLLVLLG